jgi:hypothetical protein
MKQCAGAWLFTRILAVNREYQTDPKKTIHDLKFIQRTNATADYIAWTSRRSADRRPDLVIQYRRFVAADFLPLFIQHSDSGLWTGCQCNPLDKFDVRLLFLKDLSEIKVVWCGLFAVLADRVAHISMKCCVARPAADNSEIAMKTALKGWRKVTERKLYPIFWSLSPIYEVLDTASSPAFGSEKLFFLEPDWLTNFCLCSKYRSLVFWQIQNPVCRRQLKYLKRIGLQPDSLPSEGVSANAIPQILQKEVVSPRPQSVFTEFSENPG